jgi:hypothetical protein
VSRQRRLRALAALVPLVALLWVCDPAMASAPARARACTVDRCVGRTTNGWIYDARTQTFEQVPTSGGVQERGGEQVEVFYQPACDGNQTWNNGDLSCTAALHGCPQQGDLRAWEFTRPVGATTPPTRTGKTVCLAPPRQVSLAAAKADLHRQLEHEVLATGPPTPHLAPDRVGLVNLPQIYWVDPQPDVGRDVTLPVPGRLVASPTYTWNFGDGQTATGGGTAYRPGVFPDANPAAYAVTHTYHQAGIVTVGVEANWQGRFEFENLDVDIGSVRLASTATLRVDEAYGELVAGG